MFHGGIYIYEYCLICKKKTEHHVMASEISSIIISTCLECRKKEVKNGYR